MVNRFLRPNLALALLAACAAAAPDLAVEDLAAGFKIERRYVNFLIRGARDLPSTLGVELMADGRVVRAASATEAFDPARAFHWRTWDVGDLRGRTARLRIHDKAAQAQSKRSSSRRATSAKPRLRTQRR